MAHPNDPAYLLNHQYGTAANLNARIELHRRFSTNAYGWQRFVFDHLLANLPSPATILEIGCGPADLWRANLAQLPPTWQITLTDFSSGMLATARDLLSPLDQFTYEVTDAQSLPFADATFDAAIANHMLYHVPDRPKALAELRRVIKPGGALFAATNGERHMAELTDLARQIDALDTWRTTAELIAAFGLENGESQLAPHFDHVALATYDDTLEVTEAEPLIAYICSIYGGDQLSPDRIAQLRHTIESEIATHHSIHITKSTGLFIAH